MTTVERLLKRGIVLIDKPSGPTCRDVDDRVKSILHRKKTGHSGTLDSKVTGLLVVALDEATKIMPFLVGSDKTYEGIIHLHDDVDLAKLRRFIRENFIGEITQIPPVKSRVARRPRERVVYSFELLEKDGKDISFRVKVQAGTYIRKLVDDLGKAFGVGMHMKSLRRTEAGKFSVSNAVSLEKLEEAHKKHISGDSSDLEGILIPIEEVLRDERKVDIRKDCLGKIMDGSPVYWDFIERIDNEIKGGDRLVLTSGNKVIGIGIANTDYIDMVGKDFPMVKTDRLILD
jgi:H/ACA ribonucleoprotein complex subunit 4